MNALPDIFERATVDNFKERVHQLTPESKPLWGKMNVSQMLAHLNVMYELIYDNKHPQPKFLLKWIMKRFVKKYIVNMVPYQTNTGTAPYFVIKGNRDFETEKNRLIQYIEKTYELGPEHFAGKESHAFGPLTVTEWNNMLYKHLDHHLRQFDV